MEVRKLRPYVISAAAGCLLILLVACNLLMGPSSEELETIRQSVGKEGTLVVDVRSPSEYSEGHLEGALATDAAVHRASV